jgi:hypothetical protein
VTITKTHEPRLIETFNILLVPNCDNDFSSFQSWNSTGGQRFQFHPSSRATKSPILSTLELLKCIQPSFPQLTPASRAKPSQPKVPSNLSTRRQTQLERPAVRSREINNWFSAAYSSHQRRKLYRNEKTAALEGSGSVSPAYKERMNLLLRTKREEGNWRRFKRELGFN